MLIVSLLEFVKKFIFEICNINNKMTEHKNCIFFPPAKFWNFVFFTGVVIFFL